MRLVPVCILIYHMCLSSFLILPPVSAWRALRAVSRLSSQWRLSDPSTPTSLPRRAFASTTRLLQSSNEINDVSARKPAAVKLKGLPHSTPAFATHVVIQDINDTVAAQTQDRQVFTPIANQTILQIVERSIESYNSTSNDNENNMENKQPPLSAKQLLELGAVWYLPASAPRDPALGAKPERVSLAQADQVLYKGDYLRIHQVPRRFMAVYDFDWNKTVDENDADSTNKPGVIVAQDTDKGWLVIDKPPRVPVHMTVDNAIENAQACLAAARQESATTVPYVSTPQRLDHNTSGLLVLALSPHFAGYFSKLLAKKTSLQLNNKDGSDNDPGLGGVHKLYTCLVCLQPNDGDKGTNKRDWTPESAWQELKTWADEGTIIRHYLKPGIRVPKTFVKVPPPNAITDTAEKDSYDTPVWLESLLRIKHVGRMYSVTGSTAGERLAHALWEDDSSKASMDGLPPRMPVQCRGVVEIKLELLTGRTHQIRGQFSAMGYPLVGDIQYGGARVVDKSDPWGTSSYSYERLALQCSELEFIDPNIVYKETTKTSSIKGKRLERRIKKLGGDKELALQQLACDKEMELKMLLLRLQRKPTEERADWQQRKSRAALQILQEMSQDPKWADFDYLKEKLKNAAPFLVGTEESTESVDALKDDNSISTEDSIAHEINAEAPEQTVFMEMSDRWNKFRLESAWWSPFLKSYDTSIDNAGKPGSTKGTRQEGTSKLYLSDSTNAQRPPKPHLLPDRVQLSPGDHKYVLMKASHRLEPDVEHWFVKSASPAECGGVFHGNVAKDAREWIEAAGYDVNVTGGGRIDYSPEQRSCLVYGSSNGFGRADHDLAARIIWEEKNISAASRDIGKLQVASPISFSAIRRQFSTHSTPLARTSFRILKDNSTRSLITHQQQRRGILSDAMEKRIEVSVARHHEIMEQLNSGNSSSELGKELSSLAPLVSLCEKRAELQGEEESLRDLLEESQGDSEMIKECQAELEAAAVKLNEIEKRILDAVIPRDSQDADSDAIIEVRAGTGGDEASLFASEIFAAYAKAAKALRWKVSYMNESKTEIGGLRDGTMLISGSATYEPMEGCGILLGPYGAFKYESGVHRVQRVPINDTRIHTSACSVAVLPSISETNTVDAIPSSELRIDTYRASGAGGQHVNTTDSAVRITHLPTGTVVSIQDERSQHQNKAKALRLITARVRDAERQAAERARGDSKSSLMGGGTRTERIRTYNFPNDRVTDHRCKETRFGIDTLMGATTVEQSLAATFFPYLYELERDELLRKLEEEDQKGNPKL